MGTDLSVLVRADTRTRSLAIESEGHLTAENVPGLINVFTRASMLVGTESIHIDLSHLAVVETHAYTSIVEHVRAHQNEEFPITIGPSLRASDASVAIPQHSTRNGALHLREAG